jgi:hypothetical protein
MLQNFGFETKKSVMEQDQWLQTVNSTGGSYAMTLYPIPGKLTNLFPGAGAGWNYLPHLGAPTDKRTANNKLNIAEVPQEVGALEIDGSGEKVNLAKTYQKYWTRGANEEDVTKCCKLWSRFYNYHLNEIAIVYNQGQIWGDTEAFEFPNAESNTYIAGKWPRFSTLKSEFEDIEPKA